MAAPIITIGDNCVIIISPTNKKKKKESRSRTNGQEKKEEKIVTRPQKSNKLTRQKNSHPRGQINK